MIDNEDANRVDVLLICKEFGDWMIIISPASKGVKVGAGKEEEEEGTFS